MKRRALLCHLTLGAAAFATACGPGPESSEPAPPEPVTADAPAAPAPAAPLSVDDALVALADADPATRTRAVEALASLNAAGAAPVLLDLLEDENAGVRSAAACALLRLGHSGLDALVDILQRIDRDPPARRGLSSICSGFAAVEGLSPFSPMKDLYYNMERGSPGSTATLLPVATAFEPDVALAFSPVVHDALRSKDGREHDSAAATLAVIGATGVYEALRREDVTLDDAGAAARDEMGESLTRLAGVLGAGPRDASWATRWIAARVLAHCQVPEDAQTRLAIGMLYPDGNVRAASLRAVVRAKKDDPATLEAVGRIVDAENNRLGLVAAIALGRARAVAPLVERAAQTRWKDERVLAGLAAAGPAAAPARDALVDALGATSAERRAAAARTLCRLGDTSEEVLGALSEAVRDTDEKAAWAASVALATLDPTRADLTPVLIGILASDADPALQVQAIHALLGQNLPPERMLPLLRKSIRSVIYNERDRAALRALRAYGDRLDEPRLEFLARVLEMGDHRNIEAPDDDRKHYRVSMRLNGLLAIAARTAGSVGPGAERLVEPLERLLDHDEPRVRHRARVSLRQIRAR